MTMFNPAPKPLRVALYMRVSTDEQNVDNQRPALEAWCSQRGYSVAVVYQEAESAWKDGHQSELARLIAAAQQRRYDAVLVWSLDRLTRGGPLPILSLHHKLGTWGVRVFSVQEPFTEYPSEITDVLLAFYGWVAQFESKHRSERTKAGLDRVRSQGVKLGRPKGSADKKPRDRRYRIKPH